MVLFLDFENDKINMTFHPVPKSKAKKYKVKIYAKNLSEKLEKVHVYTSKDWDLKKDVENSHDFTINYVFYNQVAKKIQKKQYLPNKIELFFSVVMNENELVANNSFIIHFVRYIPKLLNIKGFVNGEKLQKTWFKEGNNSNKKFVDPKLDAVTWEWITQESSEVNSEFGDFHSETTSKLRQPNSAWSNKIQESLQGEINKMINDGIVIKPTKGNKTTTFGVTDTNILDYNGEKVPKYEKYYFNSQPFNGNFDLGIHIIKEGIDDFIAAIANFNYHVFATGKLEYIDRLLMDDYIRIKVEKLHYYVKDGFDFVDDNPKKPSQPLGFWKVCNDGKTVEIQREEPDSDLKKEYYVVTNKDYRNYRDDHKKGYDFYLYSTLHTENVNIIFDL
ncbi:DUF6402 family protein [Chryseobacterium luquanense]|uniref:DUF6402 family protein n=1 Tax=Chryseobacterium luquanense TaxID=2983766 RepID=A0ABT3Y4V9_9FLAO|nr:DUF6402 family protein [Chryseobacterium luquanense]MCX8533186.1 DUF6402 family protein [Chryseobacterium luquanense]